MTDLERYAAIRLQRNARVAMIHAAKARDAAAVLPPDLLASAGLDVGQAELLRKMQHDLGRIVDQLSARFGADLTGRASL